MAATADGKTSMRPHCRDWMSAVVVVLEAMRKLMVQFSSARKRSCAAARFLPQAKGNPMAKQCAICGKTPQYGHHVSHAKNRVNRRFLPNLQMGRVVVSGKTFRARVCTRCLRTYSV